MSTSFASRLAAAREAVAPAVPAAYFFFAREGGFEIHAIVDPAAPVKLTDIHKYKNQGLITHFARPHQIRRR